MLYFSVDLWYNKHIKQTDNFQTSTGETVTISRAEYEEKNARLAAQDERISRLENQVEQLMEALRLANHKRFGISSEKSEESLMEQHVYYSYACKKCSKTADEGCETPVVRAPHEKSVIPGSFATAEAIAHIMTQKFVMGAPIYRQEQELNRQGIPLSRQTMSNWILRAAEDYLTPVYEQLHKELLKRDVLRADETTLQVLHEPGKKPQTDSYMWLYRTSGDTDKPVVLYEYQPGRGAQHPKAFLTGGIRVISIRTAMPDTMTWEKTLRSSDAWHMPEENSTRP